MRKLMSFLSIWACKAILEVNQNRIMNLKTSMSPLMTVQCSGWLCCDHCYGGTLPSPAESKLSSTVTHMYIVALSESKTFTISLLHCTNIKTHILLFNTHILLIKLIKPYKNTLFVIKLRTGLFVSARVKLTLRRWMAFTGQKPFIETMENLLWIRTSETFVKKSVPESEWAVEGLIPAKSDKWPLCNRPIEDDTAFVSLDKII